MDEKEFERLLNKANDEGLGKFANIGTIGDSPKTIQKIIKEREDLANKNQALELDILKKEKAAEEGDSIFAFPIKAHFALEQWKKNTALKAGAMILDFAHFFDVGDWHNYLPDTESKEYKDRISNFQKYAINLPGMGLVQDYMITPALSAVNQASKAIDNTIGDGENEVGNWVSNYGKDLRNIANRYYSDYGEGAKKTKIPLLGWSVEETLNGTSDLVGSIAGVAVPGGAIRAGAIGLTKLGMAATTASRAAHVVSTGAMSMAVSGSIGSDVYDNVQEHWLEKDERYSQLKKDVYANSIRNFYKENPNTDEYLARAHAEEQVDIFRENFLADENNADLVKNAKQNAIVGADVALKTNFVFGLATNFLMGSIISRTVGNKLTTASTRKFSEVLKKDGTKTIQKNKTFFEKAAPIGEGIMEASEEAVFEQLAQKRGELAGKGMSYGFSDAFQEFNYDETLKSAIFGFAGGAGTTALFNAMDNNSAEAKKELEVAKQQIKEFNNILEASGSLNLNEVSYLNDSAKEQLNLIKQAKNLAAQGNTDEAKKIHKKVIGLQALASFETGTAEKLKDTYTYIANDLNNDEQTRANANEALKEINQLEKDYLDIYNSDKLNKKQLFTNKINKNFANKQLSELDLEISKKKTELLADIATKSEAGKMASLEVNKKLKGDKSGDVTILQEKEELSFDSDDLSKDTSKKFEFDDENKVYSDYKNQVLTFENAKQLQQLQKDRQENLEYLSKLDDDFNELSSKEYQNKLLVEKEMLEDYKARETNILTNILNKSNKESNDYIDNIFSKYKSKTFDDSYKALKNNILNKKRKIEREEKQRKNTLAANIVKQDDSRQSEDNKSTTVKDSEKKETNDSEIKQETKKETEPIVDETLKPDSSLDVAKNATQSSLGKGFTKEEFDEANFEMSDDFFSEVLEDEDIDVDIDLQSSIEEEFGNDVDIKKALFEDSDDLSIDVLNSMIADQSAEEISDNEIEEDYSTDEDFDLSYVELDSNADKDKIQNLARLIQVYKRKKDRTEKKNSTFRDFLEDFIEKVGEQKTKDRFYALKDAWTVSGFTIDEDLNTIFEDLFVDIGDTVLEIFDELESLSIPTVVEESVRDGKKDEDLTEENEIVSTSPPVSEDGKFSIDVYNSETAPQFAYLSVENELSLDEEGYGERKYVNPNQLNNKSELDNPHDLLNYDKYLPGDELTVTIPDNFESLPIAIYDINGKPIKKPNGKSYTFGEWVKNNGIAVGSQDYMDKIPMIITNEDGESVAYVRDTGWINPYNMDASDMNDDVIVEAIKENRKIRNTIYNKKDQSATIVIKSKSNGVFNAAMESAKEFEKNPNNNRKPTLAEAAGYHINRDTNEKEYQTKVAIWDREKGLLIGANKEVIDLNSLNNEKFPVETEDGNTIYNYEVRRTGTKIEDGKKVPVYTAFVITGRKQNNQQQLSKLIFDILKLNNMYEFTKAAITNNEKDENGNPIYSEAQKEKYRNELVNYEKTFQDILENTGYDFTKPKFSASGLVNFLGSYIRIKEIKSDPKDSFNSVKSFALKDKSVPAGKSFVYRVGNTLFFGNKFQNNKGEIAIGPISFINLYSKKEKSLNNYNINTKNGKNFARTLAKIISKQAIDRNALYKNKSQIESLSLNIKKDEDTGATILKVNDLKYKDGNYENTLLNNLESSVMAYNIGSEADPFMVTNTQPKITYGFAEEAEDNLQKENVTTAIENEVKEEIEKANVEGDIADIEENLTEEPVIVTEPVEDIEAKKADIEERRQASLGNGKYKGVSPYTETVGNDIGEGYYLNSRGEEITTYDEDPNKKWTTKEIIDWLNAKYDAELAALETEPVVEDVKEQKVYRTENTFSSKVEYAQRGGGKYYALDEPFKDADTKEGDISELSVKYDANKNLDATTDEGQKEFMDIKSKAIGGKSFNSLEESNEAVRQAMLDAGYTSLIGYINNETKGNRELVIYEDYAEDVEVDDYLALADEAQKQINEEKLKVLKERQQELEKPKEKLTPEELSKNRSITKKVEDLNDEKENLEIEQQLSEDDVKKENIQSRIDKINDQVENLEEQFVKPEDKVSEEKVYTKEEIEQIYKQSEDLLAFDSDEDIDYSPIELTDSDVQRMSEDLFRIDGVNPTHQTELANYVYHEASKILTEYDGVIEKSLLRDKIEENFFSVVENKIAVFEKNRDILENVDEAKAKSLVERYNNAIDYLNTIKNNSDILIEEGLSIARKEIGVNETKEERDSAENPEVNLDNVTEKDHSKTFLEEGGKDKITYKLKRFFSDIPMVDSDGNLIKGIFGVQKYISFDEMFNTVQSILANSYPNFDKMISKLEASSKKNPGIKSLIEKLKTADKQTQNQFVTVMSKNNTGMQFISISNVKNKETGEVSYYLDIYDTNSANITRKIRNKWFNNFKLSSLVDYKQEKLFINKEKAKEILDNYRKMGSKNLLPKNLSKYIRKQIELGKFKFSTTPGAKKYLKPNTEYVFKASKDHTYTIVTDANNNVNVKPYEETQGSFEGLLVGEYSKQAADNLNAFLNNFGINLSYGTIENLTKEGLYRGKNNKPSLKSLFKEDSEENIFGALITFLENSLKVEKDSDGKVIEKFFNKETNNPLSNSVFANLATLESKFNEGMVMPTSFRDGQKTIQQYTVSKYLTDRILDLKSEEDVSLRTKLENCSFSKHSYLLSLLSGSFRTDVRKEFGVNYVGINSIKERGSKLFKTTGITSISSADHDLVKLGFFMNHKLSSKLSNLEYTTQFGQTFGMRMSQMISPTMSDKSTATVVTMPIFNFSKDDFVLANGNVELSTSVINLLYEQILVPEIQRMYDYHKMQNKPNIKAYDKGATKFLMTPLANVLTASHDGKELSLPDMIKYLADSNYDFGNETIHNKIARLYGNEIKEMFNSYIKEEFSKTFNSWKEFGIINYNENNVLSLKGVDKRYLDNKKKFPKENNISLDDKLKTLILDFTINNMIGNSNMLMTMAGDPAMYYKSKSIDPVKQSKDTFENIGKRLANQIAPGIKPADAKDNQYFQIFLDDIEAPASNLLYLAKALEVEGFGQKEIDSLKKALSENDGDTIKGLENKFPQLAPYFKIEGTDAQEYTTWKEHLYLLEKFGKTNPELFHNKLTTEDIQNARRLFEDNVPMEQMSEKEKNLVKLVMQPMKPVYTGQMYDDNAKVMRTVYIKSSSIPLIPQLTKGLEIDRLREAMQKLEDKEGKTVRASYGSANKVGSIKDPAKLFNNGTGEYLKNSTIDDLYSKFNKSKLLLDRNNFRIQQEVPFKSAKRKEDYVKQGTQTTKLLFGDGITDIDGFLYNGEKISGKDLRTAYDNNFGKLLTLKKKQLLQELNIDSVTGKSTNPRVTANKLQSLLKEEAESRGYAKQVVDSLSVDLIMKNGVVIDYEFTMPLWMSAESNRFESLLNSIATNKVAKIKMPGNSYVASSQEGFREVVSEAKGDPSKIIFTSKWQGELKGAEFDADGNLKKTQVFLPSKFRTNDGKMLNMFAKNDSGEYIYVKQEKEGAPFMLREEMFDNELLSNISFRTPTSAHLSMADVEIVGFVPYECGDLIVVPRNLTVQVGLDFDIDKQTNYQYYHEIDSNGKVVMVKDNIEDIENKIRYNNEVLENKNYEQKQEQYFSLKEKIKEEKQLRKEKINEFKKTKSSASEIELLKEDSKDIYSEIQDILEDISDIKKELNKENTKEGREELINLLKKLYKNKKLKHRELGKVNARLKKFNVTQKEILQQKKSINKNYKKLKESKKELKELRAIERKIKVYEKRLEKLYKNEIVKIHSSVLSNPQVEVQKKIAGALSIEDSRNQSEKLRQLKSTVGENSLDTFNPLTSNYQKGVMQAGAAGKVGIGAYSNDVVFHSLIRQNDKPLAINIPVVFGKLQSNSFGKDYAIREDKAEAYYKLLPVIRSIHPEIFEQFDFNQLRDMLFFTRDGIIEKQDNNTLELAYNLFENTILPLITNEEILNEIQYYKNDPRRVTEILTERQNIATDNAKELIMEDAGLNSETLDVDKVLVLLGFDKDISGNSIPFFFLNQPIIKEFISNIKNLDSKISDFYPDKEAYVIEQLIEKYGFDPEVKNHNDILIRNEKKMTGEKFEQEIINFKNSGEINKEDEFQHAVLIQFLKLKNLGSMLRSIQKNFNVDSQGIGKSTFDLYERINRLRDLAFKESIVDKFVDDGPRVLIGDFATNPVKGYTKLAEDLYVKPTTTTGHFVVNTLSTGVAITNKELPYNSFSMKSVFDEIIEHSSVSESGQLELKQDVTENMKMYFNSMDFNLYDRESKNERKDLFIDNEETGHVSLAKYLNQNLDNPNSKNFKFLNSIPLFKNFEFDIKRDGTPSIIKFNNTIDNVDENSLYSSLFLMLEKNLPLDNINGQTYSTRLLAQDLINYSLLQGGVQKAIQFNKFIPIAFLKNTPYAENLREINRQLNWGMNVFNVATKEFKKKNPNIVSDFTVQYFQHNPNRASVIDLKNSNIKVVSKDSETKEVLEFIYKSKSKLPTFFRIYNGKANKNADLYMTNDGSTYFKIPTLGTYGMESEYNFNNLSTEQFQESIIPSASKIALLKARQTDLNTKVTPVTPGGVSNTSDVNLFKVENENLIETITSIADDTSRIKNKNLVTMAKMILPFLNPNVKFVTSTVAERAKMYEGAYLNDTVYIHPSFLEKIQKNKDFDSLAKVILHETVHSITVKELDNYLELDSNKQIVSVKDGAPKHIRDLVRLFNNFKNLAEKGIEKDGVKYTIQNVRNKMKAKIGLNNFENNVVYAALNIREFITLAATSQSFQEYLHNTNYKKTDKSFFQKFKDILSGMLNSLTKNLNISLGKTDEYSQSDFTEAISATFELIQEGDKIRKQNFGERIHNKKDAATKEFLDDVSSVLGEKKQLGKSTTQQQGSITNNPVEYTNHSGGASGADSVFDTIGKEFGQTSHKHYYYGNKTPKGNVLLTNAQVQEGVVEMNKAAKVLGKKPSKQSTINLLARNWFQVKNADAVFAIAPLENTKTPIVEGGTGWAVAMAWENNKPINVFDTKTNKWFLLDKNLSNRPIELSETPTLTKNFAGIGSRKITEAGKQAIRDVYEKTFPQPQETYKGLPVVDTENIISFEGTKGAAQYDRKNNIVKVNRKFLQKKYKEKAWTKMRDLVEKIHGVEVKSKAQNLPANQFSTYKEFETFVIEHEYQHSLYSRQDFDKEFPGKTKGDYESEINRRALEELKLTKPISQIIKPTTQPIVGDYNYNPSNVSEEKRNIHKNFVIKNLGNPTSIKYIKEKGDNLYRFTFADGSIIEVAGKGKMLSYPKAPSEKIVKLSKTDSEYDIKLLIGLNKLAEDSAKTQPQVETKPKFTSPLGAGFKKGEIDVDNLSNKDLGLDDNFDANDFLNPEDLSPIQISNMKSIEQEYNLRNLDGSRKRFLKKNYKTVLKKVQQLNKQNRNSSFKFKIIEVMGEKGDSRTYYAISAIQKNNTNFDTNQASKLDDLINDFEKTCK